MAKDLFSKQASTYAGFRPGYPSSVIDHILQYTAYRSAAWDCATGNGQAAILLAPHFKQVFATDISLKQLENAAPADNIFYKEGSAEQSGLRDESVDLVTVAQAYHWFNFTEFQKEVTRVSRPGATIAIWGYGLIYTNDQTINSSIQYLYRDILGPFWDKERAHVDNHYASTPFPFEPLPGMNTIMKYAWNLNQFKGFFSSWSAVQHYINQHGTDPVGPWIESIRDTFLNSMEVFFPVFLKMGRIRRDK